MTIAGRPREGDRVRAGGTERFGLGGVAQAGLSAVDEQLERVSRARQQALARLAEARSLDELRTVEVAVLGRRSELVELRKGVGALAPDDRRRVGQALNEAVAEVEAAAAERRTSFVAAERRARLEAERLDLTEVVPQRRLGHAHLVSQAWERLEDVFVGMGFTVSEGPEIETEWYNFGALNFPEGHPARDSFDSLWVDWGEPGSTLLRTHTSPVQIRAMLASRPPIYTVCPGRVFRQDTPDATHMPVFHQIEGLVVDRGITLGDLAGTLEEFTKAYFGEDFSSRLRPSYFPFTEPSAEFDILRPDGSWLELGGCGMVHPNVLCSGGVDPEHWSGFAFGFGIDRMALMRHGVDDLREFFAGDLRFLTQF
jgi:phenylalanyl-tRNA synthetase alpha chain